MPRAAENASCVGSAPLKKQKRNSLIQMLQELHNSGNPKDFALGISN